MLLQISCEFHLECGLTSVSSYQRVHSRIVGGRQAIPHSHPWQVLLNALGKFCGGMIRMTNIRTHIFVSFLASVLNTNWILTAAHCVNG